MTGITLSNAKPKLKIKFEGMDIFPARRIMDWNSLPNPGTDFAWNWSLQDIKDFYKKFAWLDMVLPIGKLYTGNNIVIDLVTSREWPSTSSKVTLRFAINGSATVNWGDGTTSTVTGTSLTSEKSVAKTYSSVTSRKITITTTTEIRCISNSLFTEDGAMYSRYYYLGTPLKYISSGPFLSSADKDVYFSNAMTTILTTLSTSTTRDVIALPESMTTMWNSSLSSVSTVPKPVNGYLSFPKSMMAKDAGSNYFCDKCYGMILPVDTEAVHDFYKYCKSDVFAFIPPLITGGLNFGSCEKMKNIYFMPQNPPEVASSSWGIPSDCVIHVPRGRLEAYTMAAKYPNPSAYRYVDDIEVIE